MKLLTFRTSEGMKLGVKTERGVLDVESAKRRYGDETSPVTVGELLTGGEEAMDALDLLVRRSTSEESENECLLDESELNIGPCVPRPGKILCVGLNYRAHAEESGMSIPEYPVLFNKFNNGLAAHGDEISLPADAKKVDYEAELAIVIGKTVKGVKKQEALGYVFGYCAANDLSARDLQFRTPQWLLGKCLDGFLPLGPYLVTSEEVGNPNRLGIRGLLNGEVRQESNTSDMIFACDEIVSYISQYMTLEPGDIILTGTPEGVIAGMPKDQQIWLKDGDEVTVEIDGLGRLVNRMKRESPSKDSGMEKRNRAWMGM
ncbi:hypothetical protein GCM10011571_28270 [Marinithermofilum abyssi]|uniref:Fumarylacetoacetase-like C-terminal domain-containing protein n=1 Tax=Marinithermofilum abyssi TaxID=1571185 RepID=A0A8J2VHC2_9BACL|nr:fumarylacetoacetate hydrolase family protein [Marinithermofilum abyssi]GGE24457.1 hypothetical protein GCM10011571_28270 [Marinithermofilum abyssi]